MVHLITIPFIAHCSSLLWLLLGAVWLGSAPFSKRTMHRQSVSSRIEQGIVLFIGAFLLFGSPRYPDWLNQPVFTVTLPIALLGLALVACGVAFSIWARFILGDNWSGTVTVKQNHTLIILGPYRIVRHPIYTGILAALIGTALQYGLLRSFLGVLIAAAGLLMKITTEEQFMYQRFGDEYLRYRREVSTLIPYIF
jgi:protein-S-isoprenylcysteine O-methyltransferase